MRFEIIWLPNAESDVKGLYSHFAGKSSRAAVDIYNGILTEVDLLAVNPNMGRIESFSEELQVTYRSLVLSKGRFKVVYFVESGSVYIVRIWNCRGNPENMRLKFS